MAKRKTRRQATATGFGIDEWCSALMLAPDLPIPFADRAHIVAYVKENAYQADDGGWIIPDPKNLPVSGAAFGMGGR